MRQRIPKRGLAAMKAYLFRSVGHPGIWACMLARPAISGPRKWEPVPNAVVIYGITPRDAHFRWKKYHKL